MIVAPPTFVIPVASKSQVYQMLNYVIGRLKQTGVQIKHVHSDAPVYIECRNMRDGPVERVDVYLATASGDFANVLPVREEIKNGFVERVSYVHLVQGAAILYRYQLGERPALVEVIVYTVGGQYADFRTS
jgi:hypothetical protein